MMANSVSDSTKFHDCVSEDFARRLRYTGDSQAFFVERLMKKLPAGTAEELAWQYLEKGAALGAIYPQVVRQMFMRTHAPIPKEKWQQARALGVDIPPEQDAMRYEESESGENEVFTHYCRECCPDLFVALVGKGG